MRQCQSQEREQDLAAGAILALTGAGGGTLAVPLLVFGAQQGVAEAGIVRYRAALLISAMGMILSPVGLWLAHRVDNRWLTVLFTAVLMFVAYRTFCQAGKNSSGKPRAQGRQPPCIQNSSSGRFIWTSSCARALTLSGCMAGLLSGLLGVGGGFVMVPALHRHTNPRCNRWSPPRWR